MNKDKEVKIYSIGFRYGLIAGIVFSIILLGGYFLIKHGRSIF